MKDIKVSYLYKQNSLARENLLKALESLIIRGVEPVAVIFSLFDPTSVIKDRGGAFVNTCLAELFETIRSNFPITATLGQPQTTQIAVITPNFEDFDHRTATQNVVDGMNGKYSGVITFVAGAYSQDEAAKVVEAGDHSTLSPQFALNYASYAMSDLVVNQSNPVEYFNATTAAKILSGWLERKDLRQALADYQELSKIGIKYFSVENKISNLAFALKEYDIALKHAYIGAELYQTIIMLSNTAIMNFALGNKLKAFDEFSVALQKTGKELPKAYLLTFGLSMFEKYKITPTEVDKRSYDKCTKRRYYV